MNITPNYQDFYADTKSKPSNNIQKGTQPTTSSTLFLSNFRENSSRRGKVAVFEYTSRGDHTCIYFLPDPLKQQFFILLSPLFCQYSVHEPYHFTLLRTNKSYFRLWSIFAYAILKMKVKMRLSLKANVNFTFFPRPAKKDEQTKLSTSSSSRTSYFGP